MGGKHGGVKKPDVLIHSLLKTTEDHQDLLEAQACGAHLAPLT